MCIYVVITQLYTDINLCFIENHSSVFCLMPQPYQGVETEKLDINPLE